jgi:polyhydroxybutyrate depolymerase
MQHWVNSVIWSLRNTKDKAAQEVFLTIQMLSPQGGNMKKNHFRFWLFLITGLFFMGCGMEVFGAGAEKLSIEPQEIVLGMAGDKAIDTRQPLWAVYHDPTAWHVDYLKSEASWSTRDASVATVDADGVITPVRPGTTWVIAKFADRVATAKVHVTGTSHQRQIMSGGKWRRYILYVPDNISIPAPLVMVFHGGGGNARNMVDVSQMNRVAEANGFLAVYPEGTSGFWAKGRNTWNGGNCCGYAQKNKIDDIEFVKKMVARISEHYFVDDNRIYATGISNGSIMTHRLACEAPGLVTAVATVAGGINMGNDFDDCSQPVPIMMFHGTTDQNYPLEGGDGSGRYGVPDTFYPVIHPTQPDTLDHWRTINNTATRGSRYYRNKSAQCKEYQGIASVVMCIIDPAESVSENDVVHDGGGHSWPGGMRSQYSLADTPSYDINASEQMWRFFQQHHKLP